MVKLLNNYIGGGNGVPISGSSGSPITFTSNWNGIPSNRPIISSKTNTDVNSLGLYLLIS
jgi:hypothetical protein